MSYYSDCRQAKQRIYKTLIELKTDEKVSFSTLQIKIGLEYGFSKNFLLKELEPLVMQKKIIFDEQEDYIKRL